MFGCSVSRLCCQAVELKMFFHVSQAEWFTVLLSSSASHAAELQGSAAAHVHLKMSLPVTHLNIKSSPTWDTLPLCSQGTSPSTWSPRPTVRSAWRWGSVRGWWRTRTQRTQVCVCAHKHVLNATSISGIYCRAVPPGEPHTWLASTPALLPSESMGLLQSN